MRNLFTSCLLVGCLLFSAIIARGQDITVSGKVTDAAGAPLPGVSVILKGTTKGTQTNEGGNYTIQAPGNGTLSFSYITFIAQELPVENKAIINVSLKAEANALEEVVVVGYGTQRRNQIVGSVSTVKPEEINKQPVLTAAQGLQGKASGVQITSSGQPGTQPQVRIRGVGSVTGNQNPIYVVDGMITDDITNINNADIQSIEVLKDASAQAIYGSRAGNGVILVTTRSGATGRMKVGVNAYAGFRNMTNKVKMADAESYAIYTNEAIANGTATGQTPQYLFDPDNLPTQTTDWMDEITRKGLVHNYDLNISGGSEKTTYYFSAGYFGDAGILDGNKYDRITARSNNEYKIAPFLSIGHNLTVSYNKSDNKPNSAFSSAYRMAPSASVRNPDGTYGFQSGLNVGNPVAAIDYTNDFSNNVRMQGNGFINLKPIEGLTIRSEFDFDKVNGDGLQYVPVYNVFSAQHIDKSKLNVLDNSRFYYIWNNQATYHKTFAKVHEIDVTGGYSFEKDRQRRSNIFVYDVPNQRNLWYINNGDPSTIALSATDNATNGGDLVRRQAFYGRLTYTYNKRYNISGSARRDGSSSFPVNKKWGTFYSFGGSWNISEENFMQEQHLFDYLRARVGYGKVGNDISVANNNLAALTGTTPTGYYGFGYPTFPVVGGINYGQIRDAAVSWETTKGIDAGLEFGILKSRLTGSLGYYNKQTDAYIPVTISGGIFGDADQKIYSQAAKVRNKGFEAAVNWDDKTNDDFSYRLGFNITFNKNVVDEVDGNLRLQGGSLGNGEIVTQSVAGQPIGSFWVYETDGFDDKGNFKYKDNNEDGQIDENDRVYKGSYQPKTYFGFNAGFNYKAFDFSFDLYGNMGNKIYNGKRAVRFGNENVEQDVFDNRWTTSNPNATGPAAFNAIPKPSDYYIESGNFLRVNNITLGYTLNNKNLAFLKDGKLRLFATAQNPFVFTSYSGFTPEIVKGTSAIDSGVELDIYPIFSTYMFGLNFTF